MIDADLNPQVIAQVRDATDLVEVAGEHVKLKKRGRKYEGLCPFHEEKTPSFSIDPDKGLFYCFGCHQGGDAINFVMQLERLSFPEAVERLARQFGVHLPPPRVRACRREVNARTRGGGGSRRIGCERCSKKLNTGSPSNSTPPPAPPLGRSSNAEATARKPGATSVSATPLMIGGSCSSTSRAGTPRA